MSDHMPVAGIGSSSRNCRPHILLLMSAWVLGNLVTGCVTAYWALSVGPYETSKQRSRLSPACEREGAVCSSSTPRPSHPIDGAPMPLPTRRWRRQSGTVIAQSLNAPGLVVAMGGGVHLPAWGLGRPPGCSIRPNQDHLQASLIHCCEGRRCGRVRGWVGFLG